MSTILCYGLGLLAEKLEEDLTGSGTFTFVQMDDMDGVSVSEALEQAELVLIGPEPVNPVAAVQKVYALDRHISVIILATRIHYPSIKQSLLFAPFVGKNALCVAYTDSTELKPVLESAIQRTLQKRSYHHLKAEVQQKPSLHSSQKVKIEHLGSFLDQAPIGAILLDQDKQVLAVNARARSMFHLASSKPDIRTIFSPTSLQELTSLLSSSEHNDRCITLENKNKYLEITTSEVYGEEDNLYRILLINDITERKQEELRIRAILEALPQMALTTDAEGTINFITQSWIQYTGQTMAQALNEGWKSVIHPNDLQQLHDRWHDALRNGTMLQQAARYRKHDGTYRWHLVRAVPVRKSTREVAFWVGTCTDIHDQILQTEELERRVRERTLSLEESKSELEQFAHVSSHDLQEPLRKIMIFSDLLKETSYDQLSDSGKQYLTKIEDTAKRMSQSLRDLLNFTRLHKVDAYEPTDLNEVLDGALEDLELVIRQKEAVIQKTALPVIPAIGVQIKQLFYNLLSNALKFTTPGVAPHIRISAEPMSESRLSLFPNLDPYGQYVEITVQDNGIGFEQEYAEQIFTIFSRLHNRTSYAGTGIGLAICKKVVVNHHGEIVAHSKPGEGATFTILLPMHQ
ncbi:PAS domain-containing sensor histidine kinase [Telluribacter sp. SYSU D00476]|uniref:PAS domain-containing sensor histidine kinase n=1 Tax=Telluribacter sp. SYSU D00476 TaxID=2811430 RepID=UPI001FF405EA|nr:PAS domain-containing sensor histidine kinase [Telluribacter sp. SYSU D00476]